MDRAQLASLRTQTTVSESNSCASELLRNVEPGALRSLLRLFIVSNIPQNIAVGEKPTLKYTAREN